MNPLRPSTAIVCLTLAVAAFSGRAADTPLVSVPTVLVGTATAGSVQEFDAVVQPVHQATVNAQVGGNVLALRVKAGDSVRRGQALVRLDDRDVRASTARSDAAVAQADAELRNAQQAMDRNRELKKEGFISQAALDSATNQLQAAQAALRQTQAARTQATVAQGFAELVAPFDAVVLATHVEAGDLASPGRALVTLYEPGKMRAVVQVPASRVAQTVEAGDVQVLLPDGRSVAPTARELLPNADPVSQTVEWRLALPATAAMARPGQMVRVVARAVAGAQAPEATSARGAPAAAEGGRLSLPVQAILRRGELTGVYVAVPQGFALRAVRVGPAAGDRIDVLAGLRAGERVALDPVRAGLQGAVASNP
jgi:RND family efflux transporter MFP subunit